MRKAYESLWNFLPVFVYFLYEIFVSKDMCGLLALNEDEAILDGDICKRANHDSCNWEHNFLNWLIITCTIVLM